MQRSRMASICGLTYLGIFSATSTRHLSRMSSLARLTDTVTAFIIPGSRSRKYTSNCWSVSLETRNEHAALAAEKHTYGEIEGASIRHIYISRHGVLVPNIVPIKYEQLVVWVVRGGGGGAPPHKYKYKRLQWVV